MITEKPIVIQVKEDIEERISILHSCILPPEDQSDLDKQMLNELQFLDRVLKKIDKTLEG